MRIDHDVIVPARDGTPIAVNVFRPDGDQPVPVIASMSPYGKDVHWPDRFPMYDLVEQGAHMVWETPNPEWWTERGFAVVRADARGTGGGGGGPGPLRPPRPAGVPHRLHGGGGGAAAGGGGGPRRRPP